MSIRNLACSALVSALALLPSACWAQQLIQFVRQGPVLEIIGTDEADTVQMDAKGNVFTFHIREGRNDYRDIPIARSGIEVIRFFGRAKDDIFFAGGDMEKRVPRSSIPRMELHGGPGVDRLTGSYGNDFINGGDDRDYLSGKWGNDYIRGGKGPDFLYGGTGDDFLCGGDGVDRVYGNNGNDVLFGGGQSDDLRPGNGTDLSFPTKCTITHRFIGNWTGNQSSEVGFYVGAQSLFVRPGAPRLYLKFGLRNSIAIGGDWNGDGIDEFGSFRHGEFRLRINGQTKKIKFGVHGDVPISGDWDGDGRDQVGVFRDGVFYLDEKQPGWGPDSNAEWPGIAFGLPGDRPVIGDWDGDGRDDVGVYRDGILNLDTGQRGWTGASALELGVAFGLPGDRPVAGDWDGDGLDEPGVIRRGPTLYPDLGPLGWGPHSHEEVVGIPIP